MRWQALILGVVALAGTAGCDIAFATQYRQTLRPAPALDCVAAALKSSPVVASFAPLRADELGPRGPGFRIVLRDTLAAGWPTAVTREALPDSSARVIVTYTYMGFAAPSPKARNQWDISARQLLTAMRAACAPMAADTVECLESGGPPPSRVKACHPAA
jgi:hypothetical protein